MAHITLAWSLHGESSSYGKLCTTNRKRSGKLYSFHFEFFGRRRANSVSVMITAFVSSASDLAFEDTTASLIGLIDAKIML